MSAFRQMNTVMNDQAVLVKQLEKRFKAVEQHTTAQNLYGYQGDKREQTAEVIIRRQHVGRASNDIGFKRDETGNFKAIISSFDSGKHNDKWLNELARDYMEEKATKTMAENECDLEERTVLPNGAIQLRFRVNA
jgi:hypothetical protein